MRVVCVRPQPARAGGAPPSMMLAEAAVSQPTQRVGQQPLMGAPGPVQPVPCVAPAPAQITQESILHPTTSALQPPVLRASMAVPGAAVVPTVASSRVRHGQPLPHEQQARRPAPAAEVLPTEPAVEGNVDAAAPRQSPCGSTAAGKTTPLAVRKGRLSSSTATATSPRPAVGNAKCASAPEKSPPQALRAVPAKDITMAARFPQRVVISSSPPLANADDEPSGVPDDRDEHGERGEGSAEALAALQAAQGIDDRTLVVFDFDRTIMKEHMWKKYRETDIAEIRITDDHFVDLHKFRALVFSIRMKGHNVAVATFGRRDVVDKALHYALGNPHEVSIRTPADFGHKDGSGMLGNKNVHLANLAERFQVSAQKIILVDDDKHNIEAAALAGVQGQWVPEGLGESMVEQVARQVGVQPMDAGRAAEFVAEAEGRRCKRAMGRRDTGPPTEVLTRLKKLVDEGGEDYVECSSSSSDEVTPGGNHKPSARLQSAFAAYSLGQHQMTAKNFAKLCSDCDLLAGNDADIMFARVTGGGGGCLSFKDFEAVLAQIAKNRGVDTQVVIDAVCVQGRVKPAAAQSMEVPQTAAGQGRQNCAAAVNSQGLTIAPKAVRQDAGQGQGTRVTTSKRRTSASPNPVPSVARVQQDVGLDSSRRSSRVPSPRQTLATPRATSLCKEATTSQAMEQVFNQIATPAMMNNRGGTAQLEVRTFTKFCKDCGLLDKKLTANDVALIVTKVLPKGTRKLSFDDFDRAMGLIAQKRGIMDETALKRAIQQGHPRAAELLVEMAPAA